MTRRILYWYLPAAVALAAAVAFGAGFYSFTRGDTGTPVDFIARRTPAPAAAPQAIISPIVLGDSLARGTGDQTGLGIGGRLDQELRRRGVRARSSTNIAVNGAKTPDLIQQLQSPNVLTLLGQSNAIIVSIGGNDLWGGTNFRNAPPPNPDAAMSEVADRIQQIIGTIRRASPKAHIFLIGLYNPFAVTPQGRLLTPLVNRWNAKLIERFSSDANVTVVQTIDIFMNHDRLSFDRFHPGNEGYELIARRIADAI